MRYQLHIKEVPELSDDERKDLKEYFGHGRNKRLKAIKISNRSFYDRYILPSIKRSQARKTRKRMKWVANNWIGLSGLLAALLAAIYAILSYYK